MNTLKIPFLLTTTVLLGQQSPLVSSFSVQPSIPGWISQSPTRDSVVLHSTKERRQKRKPSRVTDEDGPTPDMPPHDIEEVDPDDTPELKEIQDASEMPPGPIPHQPWRRGDTNGCEDPISAEWRVEAERIIKQSAKMAGGKVLDVTWFLTSVLVTLDEDLSGASDIFKASGPVIQVRQRPKGPLYYDPEDPNPEDIWVSEDEDEIVYQRESEEAQEERLEKKRGMYAKKDEDDPEDEPHIPDGEDDSDDVGLYRNEETREDAAYPETLEAKALIDEKERPVAPGSLTIDKNALSNIAGAIIGALTDAEEEVRVLSRHELVLSSPGPKDILETQRQFDAYRGEDVSVETVDPWNSNRVLKGKLLDRNSMDVLINKKGRMVTIPLNFVKCVRPKFPMMEEYDDQEEGEEYEEEDETS